jgi:hypothetical protein
MIIFLGIKIVPFGLIQFTKEKASCQEHNRINKTKNTQITRHCITQRNENNNKVQVHLLAEATVL